MSSIITTADAARRLAQAIVRDLALYHGAAYPESAIIEARSLYRTRVAPEHYAIFEAELAGGPVPAAASGAHQGSPVLVYGIVAALALLGAVTWMLMRP